MPFDFMGPKWSSMRAGSASSAVKPAGKACRTEKEGSPVGCVISAERTAKVFKRVTEEAVEDMFLAARRYEQVGKNKARILEFRYRGGCCVP